MKLTNKIIIIFSLIVLTLFEINFFLHHEVGIDQVRHLSIVYFLRNSDHFLPLNFFHNYKSIYYDNFGFVYELLRVVYKDVGHIFNIVPILIVFLLSFIFGLKPYLLNLVSIIFSSLSFFMAYKIGLKILKTSELEKNKEISLCFILIFCISYLYYYSSLGVHNVSLFFFLVCINYFLNFENFNKYKYNFTLSFLVALACYSHKINVLMLPVGIFLFFLFSNKDLSTKIKSITLITINLFILFIPVIFIIFFSVFSTPFSESTVALTVQYAALSLDPIDKLNNFIVWFNIHSRNIGYINTMIACFAVPFFLFFKNRSFTNKLLFIILAHLILSIFINGFIEHYIRTTHYSTIILLILNFMFIINIINFNKKIKFYILIFLVFGFSHQLYMMINKNYFAEKRPDIYSFYFQSLDKKEYSSWKKNINKIDEIVKDEHKIIFYSNLSEDIYFINTNKDFKKTRYNKLKPLVNLLYYSDQNKLDNYLKKINYKKIILDNAFLLSVSNNEQKIIQDYNKLEKSKLFINNCKIKKTPIYINKIFASGKKNLTLHKITC